MKTLVILRHAKSSWATPGTGDKQRALAPRGVRQMAIVSQWYRNNLPVPDEVFCSPAVRTRQSLSGLELDGEVQTAFPDDLYLGEMDDYLEPVWAAGGENLLIIGHNPTCDDLVRYIAKPDGAAYEHLMSHHFGTANLAAFSFAFDDWSDLGRASGTLDHFVRPKDLEGSDHA